jgi:uncharacterized membrane-anchored protein YitT (DUF2179 family)
MTKAKIVGFIKSYILITFGLFINALGWVAFLIPAEIVGGGVTGLSTIIYYITDFPIGFGVLIINSILVLLAIKILGAKFAVTSIYGIITISAFFLILPQFITEPIITDKFMSALIGGAIAGVGIAIAFINGGNSGGTDIIALIINKYKNIPPGRIILYCDLGIIASSFFISQNLETVVYGYVVMAVFAYTLDLVIEGAKQSYQLTIMSQHSNDIADRITNELGRGVTLIKGTGWYTKNEIDVLLVIIRKHDKTKVMKIIVESDKNAFISQAKVSAVFGLNFDKIRY